MSDDFEPTNDSLEGEEEVQGTSWDDASDSEMAAARSAEESYSLEGGKKRLNYLFHLKQKPQKASAQQQEDEAKVDKAFSKLLNEKEKEKSRKVFEDTEEMVQAFYEYPTKQQVALKELQRNPFSSMLAKDDKATDVDDAKERREKLKAELSKRAGELQLQSVLQGPRGFQCLINGEVYGEGEKIAGIFVIKSISEGGVVLAAEDMNFTLQM